MLDGSRICWIGWQHNKYEWYGICQLFQATKAGTYCVKASSTGSLKTNCSSAALTVTYGAINSLSFTTQPGGSVTAGVALTMQPVVFGVDLYGTAVKSSLVTLSAFTND